MDKGSSILGKFTGRRDGEPDSPLALEADFEDDLGVFGFLRGIRDRCPMLELRRKTGDILAVAYGWIDRIHYDPSGGIVLSIGRDQILIRGRNLNAEVRPSIRLFQAIARHRVPWVREATEPERIQPGVKACVVYSIEW